MVRDARKSALLTTRKIIRRYFAGAAAMLAGT